MSESYETGVCVAGLSCYLGIFGGFSRVCGVFANCFFLLPFFFFLFLFLYSSFILHPLSSLFLFLLRLLFIFYKCLSESSVTVAVARGFLWNSTSIFSFFSLSFHFSFLESSANGVAVFFLFGMS